MDQLGGLQSFKPIPSLGEAIEGQIKRGAHIEDLVVVVPALESKQVLVATRYGMLEVWYDKYAPQGAWLLNRRVLFQMDFPKLSHVHLDFTKPKESEYNPFKNWWEQT